MMNTYLRTLVFTIDGVKTRVETFPMLIDETKAQLETQIEGQGKTFESLWNYMEQPYKGLNIPANRWIRAFWSNKRRIEFFTKTKTWIDNGVEREWSLTYKDEPYTMSMERLLKFNSEKVAQYLVERGLSIAGAE